VNGEWPVKHATFEVKFIEYAPRGVWIHYEAELESGGQWRGKHEVVAPLAFAPSTPTEKGK
jgi:hypothetical protein